MTRGVLNLARPVLTEKQQIVNSVLDTLGTGPPGGVLADGDYGDVRVYGGGAHMRVESADSMLFVNAVADIQPALNALTSGGIVMLAPGTYVLTATLTFNNPGVTLRGSGETNTVLYMADRNTDIVVMATTLCTIEDLTVTGSLAGPINGFGAAGTGRGIVLAQPDIAHGGPSDQITFPTIRRVAVTNTASWCIYDTGLKYPAAGVNWTNFTDATVNTNKAISVLFTLDHVNVAYWASGGGLFIGSGAASPRISAFKTNGYSYGTYNQVTGSGSTPTLPIGGVFLYNVLGATFTRGCYLQSPSDGGILPDVDAAMFSMLNASRTNFEDATFEILSPTCAASAPPEGGTGGRQYYFINAINANHNYFMRTHFVSSVSDAADDVMSATTERFGLKIMETAAPPCGVGVVFRDCSATHTRQFVSTTTPISSVTNGTHTITSAGLFGAIYVGCTASDGGVLIPLGTTVTAKASNSSMTLSAVAGAGTPSVAFGHTAARENGDPGHWDRNDFNFAGDSDGVAQSPIVVENFSIVNHATGKRRPPTVPAASSLMTRTGVHFSDYGRSLNFPQWSSCDLTGAGGVNDLFARLALSYNLPYGMTGYVRSGDENEGLWMYQVAGNIWRHIPFYRVEASFQPDPSTGDLSFKTGDQSLYTYNGSAAAFEAYLKRNLGTAAGDLIKYTASDTPARLAAGAAGQVLMGSGTTWSNPDFADNIFRVSDNGDATKKLALEVSGITTGTTRTLAALNVPGNIPVAGNGADGAAAGEIGRVNRTAQAADITSTKLTNATPAGMYVVHCVVEDTTADVTAGIVSVDFTWTDDVGSHTKSVTQTLATSGRTELTFPAYLASGDIAYAVSHTGILGTAQYALRIRIEFLG